MRQILTGMLTIAALTAGCGASRTPNTATPSPRATAQNDTASKRRGIPVQIDNQNYSDMDIYVINSGQQLLVGQAAGLQRTRLFIPPSLTRADAQVRLLASPVGARSPVRTPLLIVPPGQGIYWTIGSDPATSTATTGEI
jgi:hypothetical protein